MKKITLGIWNKVKKFIKDNNLLNKNEPVLLCVSGGPDSMMMLHFFNKAMRNKIYVFHLNHSIRKEAYKDKEVVRKYCLDNNIAFIYEKKDIPALAKNKNIEHIAREIRYKLYLKYSKKYKIKKIITAHNEDENIETFFLNLLRGKNLKALCSIPVKRKIDKDIYVIRPFLCVSKKEILKYLKENKIKYTIDMTNYDTSYLRNWIRHKLIPLLLEKQPKLSQHITNIVQQLYKEIS